MVTDEASSLEVCPVRFGCDGIEYESDDMISLDGCSGFELGILITRDHTQAFAIRCLPDEGIVVQPFISGDWERACKASADPHLQLAREKQTKDSSNVQPHHAGKA